MWEPLVKTSQPLYAPCPGHLRSPAYKRDSFYILALSEKKQQTNALSAINKSNTQQNRLAYLQPTAEEHNSCRIALFIEGAEGNSILNRWILHLKTYGLVAQYGLACGRSRNAKEF